MADATSSGSGGSGHSERIKQRLHHRPCAGGTKPTFAGYDSAWEQLSPSTEGRLGDAVKCLHGDRDIARQAVAIVLGATTRKRGLKGAISLCTEVSGLLEANRSLERRVVLQKRELDALRGSKKTSSLSSNSTDSNRLQRRRSSQSKTTQVQPSLTDRSTSPILKEIRVKSSSNQACQTEAKDTTDKDCCTVNVEETEVRHKIPDNVTEANETWLTMQDNIQLKKELLNVKSELEALKKKQSLLPMISEGQTTSKVVIQPLDEQTKGKNILPVPPTQRHAELPINQETESLPHILQPKPPGQTQDSKTKTCVHLQRKKGFRPLSSPVRVSPLQNPPVQRQPIRPIEMYSQCKCPGCVRALAEESMTVLCDKKSPKQSEILPSIGDHVVVRSDLTGVVKYIGPVCGEKQLYVGLHLDSPVGNHSGCLDGVEYFSDCPPNYGAFVHIDDVLCITESRIFKEKQAVGSSMPRQRSSSSPTSGYPKHKKAQTS